LKGVVGDRADAPIEPIGKADLPPPWHEKAADRVSRWTGKRYGALNTRMSDVPIEIHRASLADARSISALISLLTEKFIASECSAESRRALLGSMTQDSIRKFLSAGFVYHVAKAERELVGVIGIRDNTHLYHLFVREDFQRQGIGTRLWHAARDLCLSSGNPGLFTVNASRNAYAVYEKMGFVAESGQKERRGVVVIPMRLETNCEAEPR
jgi:ribosomal protein S18 acetylase RimI-like enzyme